MLPRVWPAGTCLSPVVPFATPRFPRALVHLFSAATMRQLRLPHRETHPLRFPSRSGSLVVFRLSLTRASENPTPAPGRCNTGVVQFRSLEGAVWRSQLFRKPPYAFAPLSDPGPVPMPVACVPSGSRLTMGMAMLSPLAKTGRPGRFDVFRDSITRLQHSLHTLRAPLAVALRNVRFRVAANLSRVGLLTHWVSITCFVILSFDFPMYCLLARFAQRHR